MPDHTLDCRIDEEQYQFLNKERNALEEFRAVGNLKNLDPNYLKGAGAIYALVFNQNMPNVFCVECIKAFLRPMLHQIHQYENSRRKT